MPKGPREPGEISEQEQDGLGQETGVGERAAVAPGGGVGGSICFILLHCCEILHSLDEILYVACCFPCLGTPRHMPF